MSRRFHLGDILSITTDYLVSPRRMDGVHDILDYMTGDRLFSHQLVRAARQCKPVLLSQYRELRTVEPPPQSERDAEGAWVEPWLAEQVGRYGETLLVAPIPAAQRVVRDPLSELVDMVGAERVIPIAIERTEA